MGLFVCRFSRLRQESESDLWYSQPGTLERHTSLQRAGARSPGTGRAGHGRGASPLGWRGQRAAHPDPGLMASGGRAAAAGEEEEDARPDGGCLAWPSSPPAEAALSGRHQSFPQ